MRKMRTALFLTALFLGGCAADTETVLKGTYQNERDIGYAAGAVVISFQPKENSFVQYINNREVDKGTYEKIKNNVYKITSDKQNVEIILSAKRAFEITISKLNNGKPIKLVNVSDTPAYFPTEFGDEDMYKALLDEG